VVAGAEPFVDFAIGGAFTEDSDIDFETPNGTTTLQASFDDSYTTGVRGGYWFDAVPWLGVGGMVSFFEPGSEFTSNAAVDELDVLVVPVTALLMLRAPLLRSDRVPRGHLQPYLNVGPGAFITDVDDVNYTDSNANVGVDLHAGTTWMFTPQFGMFGEYRFTHYRAELEDDFFVTLPGGNFSGPLRLETTLNTHHVLFGFAWHFDRCG
jgi:hypothetical protein